MSHLFVDFDASNRSGESKFNAITIAAGICVRLHCVQIRRCQYTIVIVDMIENEFADTSCVWIVIVHVFPYTNIAIGTGGYDFSVTHIRNTANVNYLFLKTVIK